MTTVHDWRTVLRCALLILAAAACSDASGPGPREESATARWNARARAMVEYYNDAPPMAARAYALLAVAQYNGAREAAAGRSWNADVRQAAERVAVSAASASVLSALYPARAGEHAAELARQRGEMADGAPIDAVTIAEEAGVSAARAVLLRAAQDRSDAEWTGELPSAPGAWQGGAPLLAAWGSVMPWMLVRGDQFRAPPPPAPESEAFRVALIEVRTMSDGRTAEDLALAERWSGGARTATPPGQWNAIAVDLLARYPAAEREAARIMAVMNVAMLDATIACWDSKFTYWVQRPWEADPAITTPIGRPAHPSYPSGHSCVSAAAAVVLGDAFPFLRRDLAAMSDEAGWSRVCAGIHYRFDVEAGSTIGRAVGAIARDGELPTTAELLATFPPSRAAGRLARMH